MSIFYVIFVRRSQTHRNSNGGNSSSGWISLIKIFPKSLAKMFATKQNLEQDISPSGQKSKQNVNYFLLVFHHVSLGTDQCFQPKSRIHSSLLWTNFDFANTLQHFLEAMDSVESWLKKETSFELLSMSSTNVCVFLCSYVALSKIHFH